MESEEAVEAAGSADVEVDTKDGGEEAGELEVQEEAAVQEGVSAQGDAPGNPEGDRDKESAEAEKSSAATLIQNAIRLVAIQQLASMLLMVMPISLCLSLSCVRIAPKGMQSHSFG